MNINFDDIRKSFLNKLCGDNVFVHVLYLNTRRLISKADWHAFGYTPLRELYIRAKTLQIASESVYGLSQSFFNEPALDNTHTSPVRSYPSGLSFTDIYHDKIDMYNRLSWALFISDFGKWYNENLSNKRDEFEKWLFDKMKEGVIYYE